MRIGIVINARCDSKRLPRKHLLHIHGQAALKYLLKRLPKGNVWIATGRRNENKELEEFRIPVFYGDPDNIPRRHYQLAAHHLLDAIVSIDGDDLLTSREAIDLVINKLKSGDELVRTQGLPEGMNVLWGYRIGTLKKAIDQNIKRVNDTGWGWIFDGMQISYHNFNNKYKALRMTLDTPEDLEFFRYIFKYCPSETQQNDRTLCQWIIANASKK
jgi:spore coat polysaccharide biosynthesis protein SpsF (cytidylyltransferase family)